MLQTLETMSRALPAILSLTELATLLGLPRHAIRDLVESGALPSFQATGSGGKRRVSLAALREHKPDWYAAVMFKADAYETSVFADDADE